MAKLFVQKLRVFPHKLFDASFVLTVERNKVEAGNALKSATKTDKSITQNIFFRLSENK